MQNFWKKVGLTFLDFVQTLVLSLSLFVISYMFLFQPQKVIGTSMLPNLHDADFLIAEKVSYRFSEPKRGDIVVIRAPKSEICSEYDCDYVKRIIGLPGENIRINQGRVFINDQPLTEPYLPKNTITGGGSYLQEGMVLHLGINEYLVMGDNREASRDGRYFGPISKNLIIGRIIK